MGGAGWRHRCSVLILLLATVVVAFSEQEEEVLVQDISDEGSDSIIVSSLNPKEPDSGGVVRVVRDALDDVVVKGAIKIASRTRLPRALLGGAHHHSDGGHHQQIVAGGTPGHDFPILSTVPDTTFDCLGKQHGYYADVDTACQVFHVCHADGRMDSFLCPNGTIFQQQQLVCDWWYNVDCHTSSQHFGVNAEIGKIPPKKSTQSSGHPRGSSGGSGFGSASQTPSPPLPPTRRPVSPTPTRRPTPAPIRRPVTQAPIRRPVTQAPTRRPVTQAPTRRPAPPPPTGRPQTLTTSRRPQTLAPTRAPQTPATTRRPQGPPITTSQPFRGSHGTSGTRARFPPAPVTSAPLTTFSKPPTRVTVSRRPLPPSTSRSSPTPRPPPDSVDLLHSGVQFAQTPGNIADARLTSFGVPLPSIGGSRASQSTAHQNNQNRITPTSTIRGNRRFQTSHGIPLSNTRPATQSSRAQSSAPSRAVQSSSRGVPLSSTRPQTQSSRIPTSAPSSAVQGSGRRVQNLVSQPATKPVSPTITSSSRGTTSFGRRNPRVKIGQPVSVPLSTITSSGRPSSSQQGSTSTRPQTQGVHSGRGQSLRIPGAVSTPSQQGTRGGSFGVPLPGLSSTRTSQGGASSFGVPLPRLPSGGSGQGRVESVGVPLPGIGSTGSTRGSTRVPQRTTVGSSTAGRFGTTSTRIQGTRGPIIIVEDDRDDFFDDDRFDLDDRFDDDRFDLDDRFDDDRFDLDDRFDDDRFDLDDRFDDDRFDLDDRFDDDRFDLDDRFDDDRFDLDDRFDDDRFDLDDRFDDDRFDLDDRFDFDDRFDLDDRFDDDRFDRSNFLRHQGSVGGGVGVALPSEIQLPPPVRGF